MKPLTVDTRPIQQKGTDTAKKPVSGAFLNSGKTAAGNPAGQPAALASSSGGKEAAAMLLAESRQGAQARVQDHLAALKLKATPHNDAAVRALMSEGLPLTLKLIQLMGRVQRKHPSEEAAAARIASRAMIAGIDPESPEMDAWWDLLLFKASGGDQDFGSGSPGKDRRGTGSHSQENTVTEEDLASKLAALCIQAFKHPGMAGFCRPGPLQKAWVYVPFAFSLDSVEFSGVFRILYNYSSGITEALAADITTGGTRRLVCLSGRETSIRVRFGSKRPEESSAMRAALAGAGLDVLVYPSPELLDEELMDLSLERAPHA